jgi:hypothetical protein
MPNLRTEETALECLDILILMFVPKMPALTPAHGCMRPTNLREMLSVVFCHLLPLRDFPGIPAEIIVYRCTVIGAIHEHAIGTSS